MFKNCVFKVSVSTKKWWRAAGMRAVHTMAQTAIATIGTAAYLGDVKWQLVVSASLLSGGLSLLKSVGGVPEVSEE